jgi:hypothetical protein
MIGVYHPDDGVSVGSDVSGEGGFVDFLQSCMEIYNSMQSGEWWIDVGPFDPNSMYKKICDTTNPTFATSCSDAPSGTGGRIGVGWRFPDGTQVKVTKNPTCKSRFECSADSPNSDGITPYIHIKVYKNDELFQTADPPSTCNDPGSGPDWKAPLCNVGNPEVDAMQKFIDHRDGTASTREDGSCPSGKVCKGSPAECVETCNTQNCLSPDMCCPDPSDSSKQVCVRTDSSEHCGGCNPCDDGDVCVGGMCEGCESDCAGKMCGDDGCGGSCGECPTDSYCDNGQCQNCVPNCAGKSCGDDGCGGSCGGCDSGWDCVSGTCQPICVPDCTEKTDGDDDGCGGICGGGGCTPKTCSELNAYCRQEDDGCGVTIDCIACRDTTKTCNQDKWTCEVGGGGEEEFVSEQFAAAVGWFYGWFGWFA